MFGRSFGEYFNISRFGLAIILISTIGRWAVSLSGVDYLPRGNVIFSIVLATTYLSLCYGAMTPRIYGLNWKQALVPVILIVLVGQSLVVLSTVITYAAGIDSYFNHPEALNVTEKLSSGDAFVGRLQAILPNVISGIVLCLIGQGLGKLLPGKDNGSDSQTAAD